MRSWKKVMLGLLSGLVILVLALSGGAWFLRRQRLADPGNEQAHGPLSLSSPSFADGKNMPQGLTCTGANLSPDLQWTSMPAETRSLAIVMDDVDAPLGFLHWLVYNIPPGTLRVEQGASSLGKLPLGATEGANSAGTIGYTGPCPPGTKPPQYVVRLFALDVNPNLPPGKSREEWVSAAKGHVLAEGKTTGIYGRGGQ